MIDVSAELEQKIRSDVMQEYEKKFDAEAKRNKVLMESYAENIKGPLLDLKRKSELKEAQLISDSVSEKFLVNSQMVNFMEDNAFAMEQKLRDQEIQAEKQRDSLARYFERVIETQKHEYVNIIQQMKHNADSKTLQMQRDYEISNKDNQRSFHQKINDVVRDYERRLLDQKQIFDDQLDQLRIQHNDDMRDIQRHDQVELERVSQMYEMRIAQSEEQFKEKEKNLTENFHNEMQKIQRGYAAVKKKS